MVFLDKSWIRLPSFSLPKLIRKMNFNIAIHVKHLEYKEAKYMAKDMNVCGVDRAVRIILAIALFVVGLVFNYWFLVVIGLYPFFTAMFNYCPINRALHVDSCRLKAHRKDYGAPNYGPPMGPNAGSDF